MPEHKAREITGRVQPKVANSGKSYLYLVINLYDKNNKFKPKWISTGLPEKGNLKKAQAMLREKLTYYNELEKEKESEYYDTLEIGKETLFTDYIKKYCCELDVRNSTREGYEYRLAHVTDYFRDKPLTLSQINTPIMNRFFKYLRAEGKVNKKTGEHGPMAVRTVRSIKTLVVSSLNDAVIQGYMKHNPAACLKISNKKNSQLARKLFYMEVDELNKLLQFMEGINDPITDVVKLISYYGLRRSEALGIWEDESSLDLKKRKLHIKRTIVQVKGIHDEEDTKTADSNREYFITDEMMEFFQNVIAKKEENRKFYGNTYKESEFLFTWEDGEPFRPDYLYHHFVNVMRDFGNPKFTIHNIRHSCASLLFECGWSDWEIAEWLGHKDPQTTRQWYIIISKSHMKKKGDTLNGILKVV